MISLRVVEFISLLRALKSKSPLAVSFTLSTTFYFKAAFFNSTSGSTTLSLGVAFLISLWSLAITTVFTVIMNKNNSVVTVMTTTALVEMNCSFLSVLVRPSNKIVESLMFQVLPSAWLTEDTFR